MSSMMIRYLLGAGAIASLMAAAPLPAVAAPAAKTTAAKTTAAKPAAKPAPAKPAEAGKPVELGVFTDWGAYASTASGKKECFALSQPKSATTNPPGRPRDPAYFFVTTRPAENVKNEANIIVGYPLKPDSDVTVEIGSAKFAFYTKGDGAWIRNAAEEARLIDQMRKSADVVVKGQSAKGTQSIDRYSLKGFADAAKRAADECK